MLTQLNNDHSQSSNALHQRVWWFRSILRKWCNYSKVRTTGSFTCQ